MAATNPASGCGEKSPSSRASLLRLSAVIHPSSPRQFFSALASACSLPHRRVAIAVDLSDESAFAVKWAVQNYLRRGSDAVVLLHVRPTPVLYGADWGSIPASVSINDDEPEAVAGEDSQRKREKEGLDAFTSSKARDLAAPLLTARIPFKIHIVEDHDMKERLCLEAERMGLSAMIMGSRGYGAASREGGGKGMLGSVSDYCVHHCICPVVVVRYPGEAAAAAGNELPRPVPADGHKDSLEVDSTKYPTMQSNGHPVFHIDNHGGN